MVSNLLQLRGITAFTAAGTPLFFPGAGPIPGDKIVLYPLSMTDYITLSLDSSPSLAPGDIVAVIPTTGGGYAIFKPEYPAIPEPQPQPPGDPEIIMMVKLSAGFGPVNVSQGAYEIIGHYSSYWDGLGELWISGAPDSIAPFAVNDMLRLYKCYGYVDYQGSGSLAGPLDVTAVTVPGGAVFFKSNWVNTWKCYVYNNQGTSDGCSALYLINVRPL